MPTKSSPNKQKKAAATKAEKKEAKTTPAPKAQENVPEPKPEEAKSITDKAQDNPQILLGLILIGLGSFFLLNMFMPAWFSWAKLWPLILIVLGIAIIVKKD